jgi:hypothetical protein
MGTVSKRDDRNIRKITIDGEKAMMQAQEEARLILDGIPNDIIRTYAASGLLAAALDELQSGVARESADDTLREVLAAIGRLPS